jgi:hypothetical protein
MAKPSGAGARSTADVETLARNFTSSLNQAVLTEQSAPAFLLGAAPQEDFELSNRVTAFLLCSKRYLAPSQLLDCLEKYVFHHISCLRSVFETGFTDIFTGIFIESILGMLCCWV